MVDLPDTMQAMVLAEPGGRPELRTVAVPRPSGTEAIVAVAACGVGSTVADKLDRISEADLPRIPGHELVGTVVATGPDATTVTVGDRVVAYYYLHCGSCDRCRAGRQQFCRKDSRRIGEHLDGGFAPFVALPESNLVPVPYTSAVLPDVAATVACDALATPVHVCRRAEVAEGSRVLVVGAAGGVGMHLVQLAATLGAEVWGVDVGAAKQAALEDLGVHALDAERTDWARTVTGDMDVAVDFVGTDDSLAGAYGALTEGGILLRMVSYRPVSLSGIAQRLGAGERRFTGSTYCGRAEIGEALDLLGQHRIAPVVNAVTPLAELGELFTLLDEKALVGRAAVTFEGPES